jgi:uncharacterized protein (DUF305 family)
MSTLGPRSPQGRSLWNGVHRSSIALRRLALLSCDSQRHDTVGELNMPGAMGKLRFDSIVRGRKPQTTVITVATFCGWLSTVALCSLPGVAVHAQQAQPGAAPVVQPGAPGTPSRRLPPSTTALAPQRSQADIEFMQGMIMHHGQAVEMTALIPSHTEDKEIRSLGARISLSQTDEMKFMKRWLRARGEPVSMAMPGMPDMDMSGNPMHAMPGMLTPEQMDGLRQARGAEFDRLFLTGMMQHHNGALVMVRQLFDTPGAGQDADLFDFATDVDNTQRAEIGIMQGILKEKR